MTDYADGGYIDGDGLPHLEHPAPFVIRPRKVIVLHMVYPDGTHTGDCEGCLWSQEQPLVTAATMDDGRTDAADENDDQCPITNRRCDRPCGAECIRGMFTDPPTDAAVGR